MLVDSLNVPSQFVSRLLSEGLSSSGRGSNGLIEGVRGNWNTIEQPL